MKKIKLDHANEYTTAPANVSASAPATAPANTLATADGNAAIDVLQDLFDLFWQNIKKNSTLHELCSCNLANETMSLEELIGHNCRGIKKNTVKPC